MNLAVAGSLKFWFCWKNKPCVPTMLLYIWPYLPLSLPPSNSSVLSLSPTQFPTQARIINFDFPFLKTKILAPHSGIFPIFSFFPNTTSYGVCPSRAHIKVQFFNHTAWRIHSAQRNFESLLACSMAHMHWSNMRLKCLDTPFSSGVSCTVTWWEWRWVLNSSPIYSLPPSEWKILMMNLNRFRMSASYLR